MPKVNVYNLENTEVGEIELLETIFEAPYNEHLIWESVRHFLASRRAGTAKTKPRSEVAGSGRKLWKQKGTGRARVGDIRTPKWRGGGTVHGPQPRDFSYAFPKKKRRGALRSALSKKLADGQLKVVEAWELETHKTKAFVGVLGKLTEAGRTLVVDNLENTNLQLASANLPKAKFSTPLGLNIHDVLKYENVIFSRQAIKEIEEVLSK